MEFKSFNISKNVMLNLAVIILALIIAGNIYKNQTQALEALKEKKEMELKKNAVLADIGSLENRIYAYKDLLNVKDLSSTINKINSMAREVDIKIVSIRPQAEKDYVVYIKYFFDLEVTARNYHHLGKFISRIEDSPDIYIIERTDIKPESRMQEQGQEETKENSANISISTVFLNEI